LHAKNPTAGHVRSRIEVDDGIDGDFDCGGGISNEVRKKLKVPGAM
jgi:hypothetical protein